LKKIYWFMLIFYIGLYILPLSFRPLIIPDEFRYAEIPREMIASGDWAGPHLNGLHYYEKPVMGYWLTAISLRLCGENAFGVRLPSALAAGICAAMVLALMRRFHGRRGAAFLSAFILLTSLEFYAIAMFAVLDGPLTLFVTLAMGMFYFAYQEINPKKRAVFLVLFGLFCGLAFMTKGFLALALPVLVIVPFLFWEKRAKELLRFAWLPLLTAILVVLPWALSIHRSDPDFWHYFFWVEHMQRFFSNHPQHPQPFWYFIPVILAGLLPWSGLLPVVIKEISFKEFRDPLFRFAMGWFIFPFLFFSASHGKLITYILPCFPPLAMLFAIGLVKALESGRHKLFVIITIGMATVAVLTAGVLLFSQLSGFLGVKVFGANETWKWVLVCGAILTAGSIWLLSIRTADSWKRIALFGAAPLCFLIGSHFILPELTLASKAPEAFLRQQAGRIGPDTLLVSDEKLAKAVCWVYGRNNVLLLEQAGELSYGLSYKDSGERLLNMAQFNSLVAEEKNKGRIALFIGNNLYAEFEKQMPLPAHKEQYGDFIFFQF